jgi:hypothetical protein
MKKFLFFFGILDLVAIIQSFKQITSLINGSLFVWWYILFAILYVSLLVSGFLLIKANKIGMWIYYIQFPIRLMFYAGLSFGFILLINPIFHFSESVKYGLYILCIVLEVSRLITTLYIHKKLGFNNKNASLQHVV